MGFEPIISSLRGLRLKPTRLKGHKKNDGYAPSGMVPDIGVEPIHLLGTGV